MKPSRFAFKMNLPAFVHQLTEKFTLASKELFVVGGAVRDAYLGVEPKDFDLATNATPDEVIAILNNAPVIGTKILTIGKSFGVIKVIAENDEEYEIATFRSDVGSGRRPDSVVFTSIDQDVLRRDLTINALFYDLETKEIVDYVGGVQDMKNFVIRTVGNPLERFNEDKLRILRALRFAAKLGYEIEPETMNAITGNNSLAGVSGERIRDEFLKGIRGSKSVTHFLGLLTHCQMWEQVFPCLKVSTQSPGCKNHVLLLAWLLRDNDHKALPKALNQLKYSAEEVSQVSFLVAFQSLSLETAYRLRKCFDILRLDPKMVRDYAEHNNRVNPNLVEAFCRYRPSVSGEQVMALGFQGAAIGKEVERLETENFKFLVR